MRRFLVLVCGVLGLALPASAGAAINTSASAGDIAEFDRDVGHHRRRLRAGPAGRGHRDRGLGHAARRLPDRGAGLRDPHERERGPCRQCAGHQRVGRPRAPNPTDRGATARDVTVLRVDLNVARGRELPDDRLPLPVRGVPGLRRRGLQRRLHRRGRPGDGRLGGGHHDHRGEELRVRRSEPGHQRQHLRREPDDGGRGRGHHLRRRHAAAQRCAGRDARCARAVPVDLRPRRRRARLRRLHRPRVLPRDRARRLCPRRAERRSGAGGHARRLAVRPGRRDADVERRRRRRARATAAP